MAAGQNAHTSTKMVEEVYAFNEKARIHETLKGLNIELSDSARSVLSIYREYGNDIYGTLMQSDHGKYLAAIGFADDIRTASDIDSVPIVPVMEQTVIKKKLTYA